MTWPGPPRIRLANPADGSCIGEIHVNAWKESYHGIVPESMLGAWSVRERKELWSRILGEPPGPASTRVYVATVGSHIAGFSSCGPQRSNDDKALGAMAK